MTKISIVYDMDKTLMKGYHPSAILQRRGIDIEEFWKMVAAHQQRLKENNRDSSVDVLYASHILNEVRHGRLKGLSIKELEESAEDVDKMLYPGMPEFLEEIVKDHPRCEISHNLVSMGIKHVLEHTSIAPYMDKIFGYTFLDDFTPGDQIDELQSTTSSSEKVNAIIRISYGESDEKYDFPIRNMIYLGDGQTDRPAFRFVKKRSGLSLCVYDPTIEGAKEKAEEMRDDVVNIFPADYRKDSPLYKAISGFIATREPHE